MIDDGGWAERMSARAKARVAATEAVEPDDEGRIAAERYCMACGTVGCIGTTSLCRECMERPLYTLGEPLPPSRCRTCWGEHYVWLGNAWGAQHVGGFSGCQHICHADEVWLAPSSGS